MGEWLHLVLALGQHLILCSFDTDR